jgi:Pyruvate/2-oxoacid:ferredoxin oxidoreductase delta subunit/flavodoxin
MKKAVIYYFTGTGNTAHAANALQSAFRQYDIAATLQSVQHNTRPIDGRYDYYLFLFPVYVLTVPSIMQRFLKRMPISSGAKAAVIANHGVISYRGGKEIGYESQAVQRAAQILMRRGYDVCLTDAVGYPVNLTVLSEPPLYDACEAIMDDAALRLERIAGLIARGQKSIKQHVPIAQLFGTIGNFLFNYLGRWQFGKTFIADCDCNSCEICSKACPVQTISIFNGKPHWGYGCNVCLCCYNICPKRAIQVSLTRIILIVILAIVSLPIALLLTNWMTGGNPFLRSILSFVIYPLVYVVLLFVLDKILFVLEQQGFLQNLVTFTYTKHITRYIAAGYSPVQKENKK